MVPECQSARSEAPNAQISGETVKSRARSFQEKGLRVGVPKEYLKASHFNARDEIYMY